MVADLPNREKHEKKAAAIVRKAFKPYRNSEGKTQPPYAAIRKAMQADMDKLLDWVRLDAARNLISKYGRAPAPPGWKPEGQGQRGSDLVDDLIETSRSRWAAMPKPRTDEAVAKWRERNLGEGRVKAIAITEITMAHQQGEDAALELIRKQGVKIGAYWRCEMNPCQFCAAMNGKPEKSWRKVYPAGPPSPHPACRCWIDHVLPKKRS